MLFLHASNAPTASHSSSGGSGLIDIRFLSARCQLQFTVILWILMLLRSTVLSVSSFCANCERQKDYFSSGSRYRYVTNNFRAGKKMTLSLRKEIEVPDLTCEIIYSVIHQGNDVTLWQALCSSYYSVGWVQYIALVLPPDPCLDSELSTEFSFHPFTMESKLWWKRSEIL